MKKSSILFIFILLLCIGLQYETIYYTDGSRSGAEYGLMGVSIFLALFYMIPALYFLFRIGKKWELPKKVLILSLLGGMFLSGWLSSFANTYIHDLLGVLFPDSTFGRRTLEIIATCFCFGFDSCAKIKIFVFTWNCFRFGIPND
ncbi:repair protein [Streptococcus pneumoniae]|nr:repair protein [Streptococcus pneumoniae]CVU56542.1 repair protein [Streptococcus pneumoniae]CVV02406.1 repair protein [Streptococcus pneumoniae]CVZ78546.1 repair protein [Streptococcus pneumoniae]CWB30267.1 repair protein [Streptococcus pneumoniae]